jgi:hypothetical protein
VLGFVSGIIDIYSGHKEMDKAFKDGDQDVANGAFLTAAGASVGLAGTLMGALAIPGGQVVAVVGLVTMGHSFIYKAIKGQDPIERFFSHCSWGIEHANKGGKGGADWSPTRFEDWKGDKEFDYQFEALLNIICKIEISHGDSYRDLRYKMAWFPPNSKLVVRYEELWKSSSDNRTVEGEVVLTDGETKSRNPDILATPDGKNGVRITMMPSLLSKTKPQQDNRLPQPDLKKSLASGKLLVSFDGMAAVTIPHQKWEKKKFFER